MVNVTLVTLRMPHEVHAQVVALSKQDNRSMHGQILHYIVQAMKEAKNEKPIGKKIRKTVGSCIGQGGQR